MEPLAPLESSTHVSQRHPLQPRRQTCAPGLSLTSTSSTEASGSLSRTSSASSDATHDGIFTPNAGLKSIEIARVVPFKNIQHETAARKRHTNSVLGGKQLCQPCQQLDIQKILNLNVSFLQNQKNGILLSNLGTRCNDFSTTAECPLCLLINQSRLQPSNSEYELRVYSYLKTSKRITFDLCDNGHLARDIPCLGVVPSGMTEETFGIQADMAGHLFCLEEARHGDFLFTPRILDKNADLSQVKQWLNYCDAHHWRCQNSESQVSGLKLMDCETYDVICAPENAKYVALSYVWGRPASYHEKQSTKYSRFSGLDRRITKTISDAAVATKALGYNYLWVDKLCIDQSNSDEKHHQISRMDSIYRSADVTIIAACGHDCHYGLPGVNGTPRTPQPVARLGHINVFSSMPHPHHDIQSSKWAERGWTYQEAILSRRRLVFTDDQIYFECNMLYCSETVVPDFNPMHDFLGKVYSCFPSGMWSVNRPRFFNGAETNLGSTSEGLYMQLAIEYTKRVLSFEEDRPKAFAGIMRHFSTKGIHQVWGIPYSGGRAPEEFTKSFTRGLLWEHARSSSTTRQECSIDMKLNPSGPASAPSWSWMGWRGEISFALLSIFIQSNIYGIRLELGPDSWIDLMSFHSVSSSASEQLSVTHITPPRVLLLEVDCVNPSDISLDEIGDLRVYGSETNLHISHGPSQSKALYERFQLGKLELLEIGYDPFTFNYFLMIVEKRVDCAARIGLCILPGGFIPIPSPGRRKSIRLA